MKLDRAEAWRYSVADLVADMPKWRRDRVLELVDDIERISRHHAAAAAYWHRQCTDLMAVERDRSKHIKQLEEMVR